MKNSSYLTSVRTMTSVAAGLMMALSTHADGRLIATSGVTQVEGSAGGGLVPWALITGYSEENQTSVSAFHTLTDVQDFRMTVDGIGFSYGNRFELTAAQQRFELKGTAVDIRQEIYGAKYKISGDAIYSAMPQLAAGIQYKRLIDGEIADAVGAKDSDTGTDFYVSATKVHLAALGGYHLLWNATLRATKANQMGLLGYGGDDNNSYKLVPELSALVLLDEGLAVGAEYRYKPDNLSAFKEDRFADVFVAYFPNKNLNLTVAWADLGSIAGSEDQSGLYASMTGYFK
ncbi:DUF3034 family protein [Thalassolituus oleivorans]|uniref:DUF3034 family protein n=1 Tax=Thalassolituus oleivorans TaxID=187493 RepID=UPI002409FF7B|nr:DUF3034 family protein [Thalassolituus oleivorans]MDF1639969.1 DUF3034 family protein [Thalassolituus oleivorans]